MSNSKPMNRAAASSAMSSPMASHRTTNAMIAIPLRSTVARFSVTAWLTVALLGAAPDAAAAAEPAAAPAEVPARPAASPATVATWLTHLGRPHR